jgi:hypothetical protein
MLKPGATLHAALDRAGYRVTPDCDCIKHVHWMDQIGWKGLGVRINVIRLRAVLFSEARRRGIIPAGTPIGWRWIIYYGLRDRLRAAWRAIKHASKQP